MRNLRSTATTLLARCRRCIAFHRLLLDSCSLLGLQLPNHPRRLDRLRIIEIRFLRNRSLYSFHQHFQLHIRARVSHSHSPARRPCPCRRVSRHGQALLRSPEDSRLRGWVQLLLRLASFNTGTPIRPLSSSRTALLQDTRRPLHLRPQVLAQHPRICTTKGLSTPILLLLFRSIRRRMGILDICRHRHRQLTSPPILFRHQVVSSNYRLHHYSMGCSPSRPRITDPLSQLRHPCRSTSTPGSIANTTLLYNKIIPTRLPTRRSHHLCRRIRHRTGCRLRPHRQFPTPRLDRRLVNSKQATGQGLLRKASHHLGPPLLGSTTPH